VIVFIILNAWIEIKTIIVMSHHVTFYSMSRVMENWWVGGCNIECSISVVYTILCCRHLGSDLNPSYILSSHPSATCKRFGQCQVRTKRSLNMTQGDQIFNKLQVKQFEGMCLQHLLSLIIKPKDTVRNQSHKPWLSG